MIPMDEREISLLHLLKLPGLRTFSRLQVPLKQAVPKFWRQFRFMPEHLKLPTGSKSGPISHLPLIIQETAC